MRALRILLALLNLVAGCFIGWLIAIAVWQFVQIVNDPTSKHGGWADLVVIASAVLFFACILAASAENVYLLVRQHPSGRWAHIVNSLGLLLLIAYLALVIPDMKYLEGSTINLAIVAALIAVIGSGYWMLLGHETGDGGKVSRLEDARLFLIVASALLGLLALAGAILSLSSIPSAVSRYESESEDFWLISAFSLILIWLAATFAMNSASLLRRRSAHLPIRIGNVGVVAISIAAFGLAVFAANSPDGQMSLVIAPVTLLVGVLGYLAILRQWPDPQPA